MRRIARRRAGIPPASGLRSRPAALARDTGRGHVCCHGPGDGPARRVVAEAPAPPPFSTPSARAAGRGTYPRWELR